MSRLLRGVALGAAILVTATACTEADAEGTETDGDGATSQQDGGGYGDLYYTVYEQHGESEYTSKLLRWDGTEGGEIETVAESQGTLLFHTATVTSDAAFVVYAEGSENGKLTSVDLGSCETRTIADFPTLGDTCSTPTFARGDGHELLVPGAGEVVTHYPDGGDVGKSYAIDTCIPVPAVAEGDDELSVFYVERTTDEIMFMTPHGEVVDTGFGRKAKDLLGTETLHEVTVSPNGSQICVEGSNWEWPTPGSPYGRHGRCQVLYDFATGETIKYFDGEFFAVKYTSDGLMLRKDGDLSYYPQSDDLSEPAETITEPEELADAQLIAVTDA